MQATDAGVTVIRQAVLPPLWAKTRRAFCSRIEIEMEVGGTSVAGPVTLDWSDDGVADVEAGARLSGDRGDRRDAQTWSIHNAPWFV